MRVRGALAVAVAVVGVGVAGAGVAGAQPSGSATITLSPEQVTKVCQVRLPKVEERVDKAIARITGGAEVRGSAAWLTERAEKERVAGRETSAEVFRERAERRGARVDQLRAVKARVAEFRAAHCGAK